MMTYKYYPQRPERMTAEFVHDECKNLNDQIKEAEDSDSPQKWLTLYQKYNELIGYLIGEGSRINYAFAQDMTDPAREKSFQYLREELAPVTDAAESQFLDAFLASKHKEAIAERYGKYLIEKLRMDVPTVAPINSTLRVK